jgi:restriction endonuclease
MHACAGTAEAPEAILQPNYPASPFFRSSHSRKRLCPRTPDVEWTLNSAVECRLHTLQHSVYDAIVYDSEIERKFAEDLDKRQDIKLFVKLPNWFTIETPIGTYNPDWALLKHDNSILYMVRETKGTKNFEKLRNSEAEKVRCGRRHFDALGGGVTFDVVTSSTDV